MFGTIKAAPVPAPSYAFWLARDLISMGCVFSIPPILSSYLQETTALGERASGLAAQFTVPLLAQAPLSALHLSGLDFYNRRGVSTTDRIEFLRAEFGKTVAARIVRGLVPYFIGAVVNREMRAELRAPVLLLPEPSPGKLNLACSVLKADR